MIVVAVVIVDWFVMVYGGGGGGESRTRKMAELWRGGRAKRAGGTP